ncbi:MAG: hypothetical protein FWE14_03525 [Lachnospiraceae bacterium]|nr:hypothetical protein [Lachnospiraceae bacterium]
MRAIDLEWKELSDSKEYYSNKPKPVMSIFVYIIFLMVIAGIIYSFIGSVEIVSRGIGIILPDDESGYRVLLHVDNKDIVGIEIGSRVKFEIPALPSQSYGNIYGNVIGISIDTTSDSNYNSSYYIVECTIENRPLFDRSGNEASIRIGMTVQGRIIVRQIRIIDYILEKFRL